MDKDLDYYRRRLAEERNAERCAVHPAVRAAHHELARGYGDRISAMERADAGLHLTDAA